jgi:hypothetical protein
LVGLDTFAPAQQKWIIAHLGAGKADHVPDRKFVSRLTKGSHSGEQSSASRS